MFPSAGVSRSCGISCALALLLVACAADRASVGTPATLTPAQEREVERLFDLALDRWIERSVRLQRISQRLRIAGRELCGRRISPIFGAAVEDLSRLPEILRGAAKRRFGATEGLAVFAVFPNAAAARAGVQPGDRVTGIDGNRTNNIADLNMQRYAPGADVEVELERNGSTRAVQIQRELGCEFPARLLLNEVTNAYARDDGVWVTTSLIREIQDDSMLAMIVGHELAHHILRSSRSRRPSVQKESRADYLGIYLTAMAEFPLSQDANLYLTIQRNLHRVTKRSVTHPITPARSLAFRKTLEEIEKRKRDGVALRPDY